MIQLLLHLFGDYIVQNDWMGTTKKNPTWMGHLACQVHCTTYAIPFWYFYGWKIAFLVYITHFAIDRYHLVDYFLMWRNRVPDTKNFGFGADRPFAIAIWLYIITDNVFHLIINYSIINWLS